MIPNWSAVPLLMQFAVCSAAVWVCVCVYIGGVPKVISLVGGRLQFELEMETAAAAESSSRQIRLSVRSLKLREQTQSRQPSQHTDLKRTLYCPQAFRICKL